VTKLGEPIDRKGVEDRTRIRRETLARAWASLIDDGTLRQEGTIRKDNGHRHPAYVVAPVPVPEPATPPPDTPKSSLFDD
jgi:hypothetical protein